MARSFSVQVDDWIKKTRNRMDRYVREFGQDLAQQAIEFTPVRTGFLRSNWWLSIGEKVAPSDKGQDFGGSETGAAAFAMNNISVQAQNLRAGDVFYIMNGANYAAAVENGTRGRRGRQMVGRTVQMAQTLSDAAVARIRVAGD